MEKFEKRERSGVFKYFGKEMVGSIMPAEERAREPGKKGGPLQVLLNILGVALCVIFIPIIILNVVMIVRSYTSPDAIPSVFGYSPVIVLSGSMSPAFEAGDMILLQKADPATLQVGDVVCYMEEESAVTHRIVEIQEADGQPLFVTKGDANNAEDLVPVTAGQIQGKYTGIALSGAGEFAMFLQSTPGMLIFIGGPILLILLWDVLRRMISSRKDRREREEESSAQQRERQAMEEELARLRAQVGQPAQSAQPPSQVVAPVRPVQRPGQDPPAQE